MACCLALIAGMFPRLTLFFMWLTGYGGRAFDSMLWPVLGFFFMPFTACAYTIGMNERGEINGWALALVIFAVMLDMGSHGGSGYSSRRYRRRRYD